MLLSEIPEEDVKHLIGLIESVKKIRKFPKGMEETKIRELLSMFVAEQYPRVSSDVICLFNIKCVLKVSFIFCIGWNAQ